MPNKINTADRYAPADFFVRAHGHGARQIPASKAELVYVPVLWFPVLEFIFARRREEISCDVIDPELVLV